MLKRTVLVTSFLAFSLIVISLVQEKVSNCPAHLAKQGYKFERCLDKMVLNAILTSQLNSMRHQQPD